MIPPTQDQALAFYRAALPTARLMDRDAEHRVLDADADAAWRAYGDDLPVAVRCDLVLRNFAMLYPAAFAPGPVFGLSGWYDDDPWGTGFERPPAHVVEGLFAVRSAPESAHDALDQALAAWGLAAGDPHLSAALSPSTCVIAAGARALAAVAHAFLRGERLSARTQIIVASARPAGRHILGLTCALQNEQGVPLLLDLSLRDEAAHGEAPSDRLARWADREKQRLNLTRARFLVVSPDADAGDIEAARALAAVLGADETISLEAAPRSLLS
jgi:hypothetical protein